jgi:predicted outer membrane lipoprotein
VTVVKLLSDVLSGKIELKAGIRTFSTSLICSLTAVETVAVAPPPVATKEADAPTPPPVTLTSDSSSASLSAFAEEEAKAGGKKKSTVGVGLAIAFGVLAALALVGGFVRRKNKKDKEIQAAEEMRDAEWDRQRALERKREEEARFMSDVNVSGGETQVSIGPVSTVSPPSSYTAVSLEQQEEGRQQEEDG